jgi:hypothetical protein
MMIPECMRLVEGLDPEWLTGIGELITGLAVVGFGFYGLIQYKEGQRLDAAEILLKMEKEFRCISATCSEIEIEGLYKKKIQPLLQKLISKDYASLDLTDDEFTLIKKLDRALRFFYICTILHRELHVDEGVLGRAYYYWLGILTTRSELYTYIKRDYKRLAKWLSDNQAVLEIYRQTGEITG